MADAYGMLTFTKSDDCSFNGCDLEKILNKFKWDDSSTEWFYDSESNCMWLKRDTYFEPQYPTAYPKYANVYILKDINENFKEVLAVDMKQEDYDLVFDMEYESSKLKDLSLKISPTITTGWIEIACVGNEKGRYVYFESLRVYSDGRATQRNIWSGSTLGFREEREEYIP